MKQTKNMTNNALTVETQYANIDNKQIAYRKFGNGRLVPMYGRE